MGLFFRYRRFEASVISKGTHPQGPESKLTGWRDIVVQPITDHNSLLRKTARFLKSILEDAWIGLAVPQITVVDNGREVGRQFIARHPIIDGGELIGDNAESEPLPKGVQYGMNAGCGTAYFIIRRYRGLPVTLPSLSRFLGIRQKGGEDVLQGSAVLSRPSTPQFHLELLSCKIGQAIEQRLERQFMIVGKPGCFVQQNVANVEKKYANRTIQWAHIRIIDYQ